MSNSSERKIGVVLTYVAIGVNFIISLLYTPLQIRMLGQSEFGLYSLTSSIIGYLTLMDLGFGNAIIVYTAKYRARRNVEAEKKLHGMFNLIYKIIGFITALLGIIIYLNVERIFGQNMTDIEINKMKIMMLILSFNLFITFYFTIYSSIINAYEKFTFQKIISIIQSVLRPIIMLPLLFIGYKSISLCVVITITNVFTLLSNYIYCKKVLKIRTKYIGFDKTIFKTIIGYSIWIFIGIIVDKANWSVDNFVLGTVSGTIAVSVYSIAAHLNTIFISLSTAISGIMLPKMSKLVAKKSSTEELTNEMIKVGRLQNYIIFLMCSGLILFGKKFITIWAGKNYIESYYVALLLIIPVCVPLIQNLGISIMQAMNKYKFKSLSTLIMAIINIIISVYLSKKYGATGAALGTCISLVICNIIIINIYYHFKMKLNILKFWKEIIAQTIPLLIPILLILVLIKITTISGISALLIYGSTYVFMYFIVAYNLSMNKYEKDILNKVFRKMHLKR